MSEPLVQHWGVTDGVPGGTTTSVPEMLRSSVRLECSANMCPVAALLQERHRMHASAEWLTTMRRVLDALPQFILLCDGRGTTLHVNRSARQWFLSRSGWRELEPAVRAACGRAFTAAQAGGGSGRVGEAAAAVQVSSYTADGWYLVEATAVSDADGTADRGTVMIVLEPPEAPWHRDRELRDRYRLTPTEIRVAKLLAQGQSNRQIASDLRTSVHTVRHHVEHVFGKLGIHNRAAARAVLGDGAR